MVIHSLLQRKALHKHVWLAAMFSVCCGHCRKTKVLVAMKTDILNWTWGQFPAVFVVTRSHVLSPAWSILNPNQVVLLPEPNQTIGTVLSDKEKRLCWNALDQHSSWRLGCNSSSPPPHPQRSDSPALSRLHSSHCCLSWMISNSEHQWLQRDPQFSSLRATVHFLHAGRCSSFCRRCPGHQSTFCRLFSFPAHQSWNELLTPVETSGSSSNLQRGLKILDCTTSHFLHFITSSAAGCSPPSSALGRRDGTAVWLLTSDPSHAGWTFLALCSWKCDWWSQFHMNAADTGSIDLSISQLTLWLADNTGVYIRLHTFLTCHCAVRCVMVYVDKS